MIEEVRYPTIMPMMSNMRLLRTKVEKKRIMAKTEAAPTKAPTIVAMKPDMGLLVSNVPPASMTMATPRDAPVSMPSIEGPAKGLLNVVCSNKPATARLQPANRAVMACGMRDSMMI